MAPHGLLTRIADFFDGTYFAKVSDHYRYQRSHQRRLSCEGIHNFIRAEAPLRSHLRSVPARSWSLTALT